MMTILLSNGYVFWSVIGLAILVGSIYFAEADLSRTDYSSWWWRFLKGSDLKVWFWMCFVVFLCLVAVTVVFGRKADVFFDDTVCRGLIAADAVLLFVMVVFLFMRYCKACWGTMPVSGTLRVLVILGFMYGVVLLLTNPSIPDGAIVKAFGDALTMKLKNESMTWFKNIHFSNFQTYVSAMCDSGRWRMVWYTYLGVCVIQLLLRNGWMHTSLLRHRIFCPIMTCLLSLSILPVALLAGFILCAWSLYALVVIVSFVVGVFMLWLVLAMMWSRFTEETSSSEEPCGTAETMTTTTYRDSDGNEYVGHGENPSTIEGRSFGNMGTYDKGFDGKYHERWGYRVLDVD